MATGSNTRQVEQWTGPARVPPRAPLVVATGATDVVASSVDLARGARGSRAVAGAVILAFDVAALSALLVALEGWKLAAAYIAAALVTLAMSGGYRARLTLRALEAAPWLAGRMAIALVMVAPVAWWARGVDSLPLLGVLAIGLVVFARIVSYAIVRALRQVGTWREPAIILGAGQVGCELAALLREYPEYGLTPVGFVTSAGGTLPLPVLGGIGDLDGALERTRARDLIVAFDLARSADLVSILRTAVQHDVTVYIVPRFFDCGVVADGPDTDDVRGIPLYRVRRAALRRSTWFLKRLIDITVSSLALAVLWPVFAVIAVAVKWSSPGPVLFRQGRVGKDGREIEVLKFRTLQVNADSDTQWSVSGDDRRTPIGRLLRRTSLDELPQLWSVLRGDMSLIGPRPERPFFVDRFTADVRGYGDRHRVRAGLTGWAQVNGLRGDESSIAERARYDNNYIEHWSPWKDFVIALRTASEVVRHARSEQE
jgi:exopolysaccharide biosynthesis polyprenyl glycosylphosphotransferase